MPTNIGAFTVFGAIEQKWLALGGVKGLLGAPLSNESPTFDGAGRAQTFRGGIVSWHPTIGAHEVHGVILARWLEVGREQFGHPITDESPCVNNIGRFNHFRTLQFPGPPECSIYWSPATGPHDIFGAIRDKWTSMGFERGVLGYPVGSEHDQPGGGKIQQFQGGVITNTGAFTVFGAIEEKWLSLGGVGGLLGAPLSNESPTFDGVGRAQTFQKGIVSWHPAIGAHEVHGAILARWLEVGREQFGYPITDESPCPDNKGRFNHFRALQFPGPPESSIYWTLATGPHDIFGAIRDTWASMGFERSFLGYPTGSEHDLPGIRAQNFQGGVMTWTASEGASAHKVSGDTVTFDSGQVNSDLAQNGNVQLTIQRNGAFTFSTHAHDSGGSDIGYAMVAILATSAGDRFSFAHKGSIHGVIGDRDDDLSTPGQNPALAAAFNDIAASGRLLPKLTGDDKLFGAIEDLLADAAKQLVVAGIKALVTVLAG